jgi:hypothetical protein
MKLPDTIVTVPVHRFRVYADVHLEVYNYAVSLLLIGHCEWKMTITVCPGISYVRDVATPFPQLLLLHL